MHTITTQIVQDNEIEGHGHVEIKIFDKKTKTILSQIEINGCACKTLGLCADDKNGYDAFGPGFELDRKSFDGFIRSIRSKKDAKFSVEMLDEIISIKYMSKQNSIIFIHESWVSKMAVVMKSSRELISNIGHMGNVIETYIDECKRQRTFNNNAEFEEPEDDVSDDIIERIQDTIRISINQELVKNKTEDDMKSLLERSASEPSIRVSGFDVMKIGTSNIPVPPPIKPLLDANIEDIEIILPEQNTPDEEEKTETGWLSGWW